MRRKKLKILFVAAEAFPYAEVGGLSRVAYFLPLALAHLGHDVRVMIPKYGKIDEDKYPMEVAQKGLRVPTGGKPEYVICNVKSTQPEPGLTFYFLENREYYEKRANEYGYSDDPLRFTLLVRGTLEYIRHSQWVPDVIHTNDWHTSHLAQYLQTIYRKYEKFAGISTIFTIHNLSYQGSFDHRFVSQLDFDDGKSDIPSFFDRRLNTINAMRRGIIFSDMITTVSPSYAKEILTPRHGEGLDELLKEVRTKLVGILNGIDYEEFNPKIDKILVQNFSAETLTKRKENKIALQREFNLPENESIPILAFNGRLYEEKGLALILEALPDLITEYDMQFILNGGGDNKYRELFQALAKKYPTKVGVNLTFDFTIPRHIYAGADIVLVPSRFEPCGIVQMEAMRYGAVPVVHNTGGLGDTVRNFNPTTLAGTGFTFQEFTLMSFYTAVIRALETYRNTSMWRVLVKHVMKEDLSWVHSAKLYERLYYRVMALRVQKEESKVLKEG